ncbi:fumarate reductase 1 [[Candida] jaroonii]|uniref:Fumarate reductase 1 n=1 Tax=[Candida] jaroonii TaxID=467808 RepID=A0ACA9Y8C8_9ASCO|nr:fumarate reductase 1 [[Candida] jaroonii]
MDILNPVIIVGGGLAGLSAAHKCYLNGSNVILVDKQSFLSGNSGKATSGINGALTNTQIEQGIKDSVKTFYDDTLTSAKDRANPSLIKVLVSQSAASVQWLQDYFNLDLTVVSRLGGHSQPRTHRGKDSKFPGMAITYKLLETLEDLADAEPKRVKILKNTQCINLIIEEGKVEGIEVKDLKSKSKSKLMGPVIMCTGGYAADFTKNSLLRKYRPDIYNLPSTNGVHATGDGQKIMIKNNASSIDMDKVQVHPTGLIPYNDKDVIEGVTTPRFLFLGAEALRGEGGIMLNSQGRRFVNELGTRDYVSGEMSKQEGPIRLILNEKAASNLQFHVKHYEERGLMKKMNGKELVQSMGVEQSVIEEEFKKYNEKNDNFGKQYFPNLPLTFGTDEIYHVSFVTRVLHFTMGGIKINDKSQVLSDDDVIEGLYAAGEVAGGVHGHNRLGGSSLLACVVFGRLSADQCCNYLLQKLSSQSNVPGVNRLQQISLHLQPGKVIVDYGDTAKEPPLEQSPKSEPKASEAPKDSESPSIPDKQFTMDDIAKHNKPDDCWCVVKGVVLDLTSFLDDHPGGKQSILNFAGKDATTNFEMLHDDSVVKRYAPQCIKGTLKGVKPTLKF